MAEVIGVSASAITLVSTALKSAQHLKRVFDDVKDAPKILRDARSDLVAIEPALKSLLAMQSQGNQRLASSGLEQALENCASACQAFEKRLNSWMKYSKSDKLFWVDRWRIGLYGQAHVESLRSRLSSCKQTLTLSTSTALLLAQISEEADQEDVADDLRNHEKKIIRRADTAAQESATIDKSIQPYYAAPQAAPDDTEKEALLCELQAQKAANESYRRACKDCMDSIRAERQEQKIGNIRATDHSQAIGGYYNAAPELQEKLADRAWNIGDITADGHSFAGGGVINNVDIRRI